MKREIDTKFFTFSQNNSGGYFIVDEELGIGEYIIIEAINKEDAQTKFKKLGEKLGEKRGDFYNYCSCCGDRWSDYLSEDDGKIRPEIYGESPEEHESWGRKYCFVHYFDGKIEKRILKK